MKKFLLLFVVAACVPEKGKQEFEYSPFAPGLIHLSFPNDLSDTISITGSIFTNIPPGVNETRRLSVVSAGEYFLDIELDRPAKSSLNIGGEQFNVFIFPRDTTHITIVQNDDGFHLSFRGRAKEVNEYYLGKKTALGYTDIRFAFANALSPWSSYDSLKADVDSVVNHELSFFKEYTSSLDLPRWFLDYEEAEIIYAGAGFKTQMPVANQVQKYFRDSIPGNFYDFLEEVPVDNPTAILSSYYFWFLDDFFLKDLPLAETRGLSAFEKISRFGSNQLALSNEALTGYTKQLYQTHLFSKLVQYYSDTLEIDSLATAFHVKDYKEFIRLSNIRSRTEIQALNLKEGDTIPEVFLADDRDSLISIRAFRDQVIYINFWATWCGPCLANIPNLNKLIDHYAQNQRIRFFNICLDSEKPKWLISIDKYQLRGVNLYAEKNWNAKLRSNFNIKGIPHYMIINKGNVLLENFSSSAPDVKNKLDALLAVTKEQL